MRTPRSSRSGCETGSPPGPATSRVKKQEKATEEPAVPGPSFTHHPHHPHHPCSPGHNHEESRAKPICWEAVSDPSSRHRWAEGCSEATGADKRVLNEAFSSLPVGRGESRGEVWKGESAETGCSDISMTRLKRAGSVLLIGRTPCASLPPPLPSAAGKRVREADTKRTLAPSVSFL